MSNQKLIEFVDTIREEFDTVEDPRVERSRLHDLDDILIISLIACICGMNDVAHIHEFATGKKEWFSEFLNLPYGIPGVSTFRRIFAVLDPDTFNACFEAWTHRLHDVSQGQIIALDGKVVRGSKDRYSGRRAINIVNAWASGNRLVIGQQPIDSKSNEITAIPILIERLNIAGCLVTADALNCQKSVAESIRKGDADYLLSVKDNHPTLKKEIASLFDDSSENKDINQDLQMQDRTIDKGHDRIEIRNIEVREIEPQEGQVVSEWPEVKTAIRIVARRIRIKTKKESIETRYYISSRKIMNAAIYAQAVRSHWEVENCVHWVLDVAFDEDRSTCRAGHSAQNWSTLRKLTLNMLRLEESKISFTRKRLRALLDQNYLLKILSLYCLPSQPTVTLD